MVGLANPGDVIAGLPKKVSAIYVSRFEYQDIKHIWLVRKSWPC